MARTQLAKGREIGRWGPFADDLEPPERLARLRALRAFVQVFAHSHRQLLFELKRAELLVGMEASGIACRTAKETFETLPALTRRKILASYGELR